MLCETLYGVDERLRRGRDASNNMHRQFDEHPNRREGGDELRRRNKTRHSCLHDLVAAARIYGEAFDRSDPHAERYCNAHYKHADVSVGLLQCCQPVSRLSQICAPNKNAASHHGVSEGRTFAHSPRISARSRPATISIAAATAGDSDAPTSKALPSMAYRTQCEGNTPSARASSRASTRPKPCVDAPKAARGSGPALTS